MAECKLCKVYEDKNLLDILKIYEDDICVGVLSKKPASICHVMVYPKRHATILEQVGDNESEHMFAVCNKISQAMFESINIQGTNIFIQNGAAAGQDDNHFCMHIIARRENDGLKLNWEPRQLSEEEMSTVELSYKQMTQGVVFEKEKAEKKETDAVSAQKKEEKKDEEDGENYLYKYFDRKP